MLKFTKISNNIDKIKKKFRKIMTINNDNLKKESLIILNRDKTNVMYFYEMNLE